MRFAFRVPYFGFRVPVVEFWVPGLAVICTATSNSKPY